MMNLLLQGREAPDVMEILAKESTLAPATQHCQLYYKTVSD
jgi:hypothetical protein